jgi:hypothetical protein
MKLLHHLVQNQRRMPRLCCGMQEPGISVAKAHMSRSRGKGRKMRSRKGRHPVPAASPSQSHAQPEPAPCARGAVTVLKPSWRAVPLPSGAPVPLARCAYSKRHRSESRQKSKSPSRTDAVARGVARGAVPAANAAVADHSVPPFASDPRRPKAAVAENRYTHRRDISPSSD